MGLNHTTVPHLVSTLARKQSGLVYEPNAFKKERIDLTTYYYEIIVTHNKKIGSIDSKHTFWA